MAALGVPPMLWLAARRSGHAAANALAWPAIGVLFVCLMLSYSRGALVALVLGIGLWFLIVPLRLRAIAVLAAGVLGAAPVVAWAFAQDGLTTDRAPIAARVDAGHEFGALLLLMVAVLLAAGPRGCTSSSPSARPTPRTRRLVGRAALGVLVAAAGRGADRARDRGRRDQRPGLQGVAPAHRSATPRRRPTRPTASPRRRPSARGTGRRRSTCTRRRRGSAPAPARYATIRTRFRTDALAVRHAHGYVVQTLADLGWAGLAASLLAAIAWLAAAARATGVHRRARGLPWDAERVGMVTLAVVVVIFGIHSAIDWTWFVPANAGVGDAVRGLGCRPRAAAGTARAPRRRRAAARRLAACEPDRARREQRAAACTASPPHW